MPKKAKAFVAVVILLGVCTAVVAAASWRAVPSLERIAIYVTLTAIASMVKLRLPGLDGTYSLNSIFLLGGAVYLTLPEVVLAAIAGVLVQSYFGAKKRPALSQTLFNLSNECFSIALASLGLSFLVHQGVMPFRPALLAAAAAVYFVLNTGLVSGILSLLGGGEFRTVNKQWYSQSFPYYLLGAAFVGLLPVEGRPIDLEAWAVIAPIAYLAHFFCGLAQRAVKVEDSGSTDSGEIPSLAKAFTGAVAVASASFLVYAVLRAGQVDSTWFASYFVLALLAATWKVKLPGANGTVSLHYVVVLVAIASAGLAETLVLAAAGPLVQSYWRARSKPRPVQVVFNVAAMVVSAGLAYSFCRILAWPVLQQSLLTLITCAAVIQFLGNTVLVSSVISLVEKQSAFALWRNVYFWVFPIYMVGAAAAAVMVATARSAGWAASLLILPLMVMAQVAYRTQLTGLHQFAPAGKPGGSVA
ncbi:MAG: hypothetical protein IH602_08950 [Bryobacteraceae bacterium]|nr:hypothetical protein [Bryobacteraceae bacterium]